MLRVTKRQVGRAVDVTAAALFPLAVPFLVLAARRRWRLQLSRGLQDRIGVTVVRNHYYEPVTTEADFIRDPAEMRALPGIDFNLAGQIAVLEKFNYGAELQALEGRTINDRVFSYANPMLGAGDAEALYSFIRAFRPATIVEVGSGHSTLVARLAIAANLAETAACAPRHICFEPFENPWLEGVGAEIRRERIERADLSLFGELQAGDLVFIDSSHVVRPMGDVECEFLRILPVLPPGVLVHVHDIFTPRDYPAEWLRTQRRLWTEQYLLEAFLSFNSAFEVMLALNDLHHRDVPALRRAFPILAAQRDAAPGSFWIRRKQAAD